MNKKLLKILNNWTTLNAQVMALNKKQAIELLDLERSGRNRSTFIVRIQQRIVGASSEELNEGFSNEEESKSD